MAKIDNRVTLHVKFEVDDWLENVIFSEHLEFVNHFRTLIACEMRDIYRSVFKHPEHCIEASSQQ